jgi:hypothetical protein
MALPLERTSTGAVLLRDGNGFIVMEQGTTVPTSAAGYAKGAIFFDTDVVAGTGGTFLNKGTTAVSNFTLVTQA